MKLYFQSNRDSQVNYTVYDGMDQVLVLSLMADLGHTDIQSITEEDYLLVSTAQ